MLIIKSKVSLWDRLLANIFMYDIWEVSIKEQVRLARRLDSELKRRKTE